MNNIPHKVTIKVTPDALEAEIKPADPAQTAYVERYLTRSNDFATTRTYVRPEVHRILSRMVKANAATGATIGGYLSEIVLDHFARNADIMKRIFENSKEELFE